MRSYLLMVLVGLYPVAALADGGLQGYISYDISPAPSGFTAGIGFYAATWSLLAQPLDDFQIGLPGTWILPDNTDDTATSLCPANTSAPQSLKNWGPTYDGVFQTIEGGLGYWAGNQFTYGPPKFSMNGTPDCYTNQIASPGWPFFSSSTPLPDNLLGIAQLSNRLLVPPDGLTLGGAPNGSFLGYTYLALPWLAAMPGPPPTGDQSWTLFLNASNFKGPVAFYTPKTWSRISATYPFDIGRGLDSRRARVGGGAIEVNTVPFMQATDNLNELYGMSPQLRFPVNAQNQTALVQQVTYYSDQALFDCLGAWRAGGGPCDGTFGTTGVSTPTLSASPLQFTLDNNQLTGFEAGIRTQIFNGNVFGLQWAQTPVITPGQFPAFSHFVHGAWQTVAPSQVPADTGLATKSFAPARVGAGYSAPNTGAWMSPGPTLGPYTISLADGSSVTYQWYRFVDQPSLQSLGLTTAARCDLQNFIQKVHASWPISRDYMPPLSNGTLTALDAALLVTPPKGLEVGYVPIVTAQVPATHCDPQSPCPQAQGCHVFLCNPASRTCEENSDACTVRPPADCLPAAPGAGGTPTAPAQHPPATSSPATRARGFSCTGAAGADWAMWFTVLMFAHRTLRRSHADTVARRRQWRLR